MQRLILASGSAIRAKILTDVGIDFDIIKPDVDEAIIKTRCTEDGLDLEKIATELADAKALAVDAPANALVLGSDQIMEHRGVAYDKPRDLAEAADRLEILQGDVHTLINAVTIVQNGKVIFRNIDRPHLYMRSLTKDEINLYIDEAGPTILSSVGAYQVERLGARLFEKIEGDYFAVLGLSLFPVLKFLRETDVVEF